MSHDLAYPVLELDQGDGKVVFQHMGMTMLDEFAKAAMQGLILRGVAVKPEDLAHTSYKYANSMIAERGKW